MKRRLYAGAILAGLGLVIAVALVVFAYGRNNPSPPSLEDNPQPQIPGEVLYLNQDFCFVRAAASGGQRSTLTCIPGSYSGVRIYWLDETTAGIIRYDSRGGVLWRVDLQTGAMSDTGKVVDLNADKVFPSGIYGGAYAPDGTFASVDEEGRLSLLIEGKRAQIAEFDTPDFNQPQVILWSPDSQWILLQYYSRRAGGPELWIVSRDGSTQGTLSNEAAAGSVAWRIGADVQPGPP